MKETYGKCRSNSANVFIELESLSQMVRQILPADSYFADTDIRILHVSACLF